MNAVYSNKKSTHQSASFQFPYFITFGRESLPHQCNQGNRIIYSFTGVMFYKVVQHKSWRCKWRNSNAKLLTCSEINDQKQCACCHVSRGAGVPSVSHSHSKAFRLLSQTVRLPIQQHELPAVCCMLTVQVSCNQDFEYSKKKQQTNNNNNNQNLEKSFLTIWPLWPRMRLLCALGLFLALLHLSTSLLLGAFNIKTFGDKKSSNATLMNIISTVWNCNLYSLFLFLLFS